MKVSLLSFLLVLGCISPTLADEAEPTQHLAMAPADHYFGKIKMSILGVRNSVGDLTATISANPETLNSVIHKAEMIEEAVHDWAKQYPTDPWIPKYAHALVVLYQKCHESGDQHSLQAQDWINQKFPDSAFAEAY